MKRFTKAIILILFICGLLPVTEGATPELLILNQSEEYLQQGQAEQAVKILEDNALLEHKKVNNILARALLLLGDDQAVIDLYQGYTGDLDWEDHYHLGVAYHRRGSYSEALQQFQQGLAIRAHTTLLHNHHANTLAALGQYEEAIASLEHSLRLDASQSHLYWRIGEWAELSNDTKLAIDAYSRAQSFRPVPSVANRLAELKASLPTVPLSDPVPQFEEPKLIDHSFVEKPEDSPPIRIGLLEKAKQITFSAGTSFTIKDDAGRQVTGEEHQLWQIRESEESDKQLVFSSPDREFVLKQPVTLELQDQTSTFALYDVEYGQGYFWSGRETREYRGDLEVLLFEGGITLVNELPIEEYLYSVVASEMNPSWHLEAIKAQAVAARTYSEFNRGRYASRGFDLLSSVLSAYYPGVGREHPRSTEAVNSTWRETMTYRDRPIDAVYSANNGGIRSASVDVWGGQRDYLLSSDDGGEFPTDSFSLARWLKRDADSFSNIGRQFSGLRWQRQYSREQLERIAPASIGNLVDLRIVMVSDSHRVQSIQWIGTTDSVTVRGDSIRSSLGGLRSNLFIFYPSYTKGQLDQLTIFGAGWGHGVGMSQTGALGMAEAGFSYKEILNFYYDNITLQPIEL